MRGGIAPASVLAPPVSHRRFPLFDALRAIAAITILVVHVAIFSGALENPVYGRFVAHLSIGVPFFFLLSAFLLYRPFVAARVLGAPKTPLSTYARRRFLRVMPAYWLALTVAAIVPGMAGAFGENWFLYYGLLQNYPIYTPDAACLADSYRCGISPAWTLAIEVAFYAALPLFALGMNRLTRWRGERRWLAIELWVVLAITLASLLIQSYQPTMDLRAWLYFSPLGHGWWFGLGLALASLSVWVEQRGADIRPISWARSMPLAFAAAGVGLYVLLCLILGAGPAFTRTEYVLKFVLFGVIAALVMLPAIFGQEGGGGLYRRVLAHPLLGWLGLISYGIFLWQFPVLIFLLDHTDVLSIWPGHAFPVLTVTTFAGTIVCAAASYYALERPLQRLAHRRGGGAKELDPPAIESTAWRGSPS